MFDVKGFLIDLNGTVYSKDKEIEGSFKFIRELQKKGISYRLLTNTASLTISEVKDKLSSMGLEVKKEEIINPIIIADYYMKEKNIKNFYFAGEIKIKEQFQFSSLKKRNPEVVILGDMQSCCSYEELNKIYNYLINGSQLISTSYSDFYISENGRKIDTGAFTKLFENLVNKDAMIVGKPSELFYKFALKSMELSPKEVIAIGDDIKTDIRGAKSQGIYSVLVKTGKYNPEVVKKIKIKPDEVVNKLIDLFSLL